MKRSTIALTIEDFGKTAVDIGRLAENKAVQVRVDLSKILLQEPKATASLVVESPSGDKYPAITRMEGKTLIWDVAAADVASAGKGKVQLNVIGTNGEVLKSAVAVIRISGSIVGNGQAPNPVQNWIDSATKALNEAYAIVAELQQKLDDGEFVGPQGDPGATGATPNIQIGSVETGNPGTDAEASMSGTPEAPILNLKIPRGADGSGSVSKVDGVGPASGNVPLGAVRYSAAQNLTEAQQAQARENISAAKNAAPAACSAASRFPWPMQRLIKLPAPMPSVKPTVCSSRISAKLAPTAAESDASRPERTSASNSWQAEEASMAATLGAAIFSVSARTSPESRWVCATARPPLLKNEGYHSI